MILHSGWGFVSFCSGAIVEATSVMQYRSVLKTLKPVEFPEGYWVEIGVYTNLLVATIGVAIIFISFLAYSEVRAEL